jgi:hypothetical protein
MSFSDRQDFTTLANENVTVYFTADILQRTVNFAKILSFQPIRCQNGVIFVIDNVLVPNGVAGPVPTSTPSPFGPPQIALFDLIQKTPNLSTLGTF